MKSVFAASVFAFMAALPAGAQESQTVFVYPHHNVDLHAVEICLGGMIAEYTSNNGIPMTGVVANIDTDPLTFSRTLPDDFYVFVGAADGSNEQIFRKGEEYEFLQTGGATTIIPKGGIRIPQDENGRESKAVSIEGCTF